MRRRMEMRFVPHAERVCYGLGLLHYTYAPEKRSLIIMDLERFFGGNPLGVLVRLVVISVVVGIIMSALGLTPGELFRRIDFLLQRLYDMGFRWVESLLGYFLIGAVIVVPIWLIARLFGSAAKK